MKERPEGNCIAHIQHFGKSLFQLRRGGFWKSDVDPNQSERHKNPFTPTIEHTDLLIRKKLRSYSFLTPLILIVSPRPNGSFDNSRARRASRTGSSSWRNWAGNRQNWQSQNTTVRGVASIFPHGLHIAYHDFLIFFTFAASKSVLVLCVELAPNAYISFRVTVAGLRNE